MEPNLAAEAFLNLMLKLRVIVLQDSVILRPKYISHPVFQLPIFHSSEYKQYSLDLHNAMESAERNPPFEQQLRNVMPSVVDSIHLSRQAILLELNTMKIGIDALLEDNKKLRRDLNDISSAKTLPPLDVTLQWRQPAESNNVQSALADTIQTTNVRREQSPSLNGSSDLPTRISSFLYKLSRGVRIFLIY